MKLNTNKKLFKKYLRKYKHYIYKNHELVIGQYGNGLFPFVIDIGEGNTTDGKLGAYSVPYPINVKRQMPFYIIKFVPYNKYTKVLLK